MCPNCRSNTCIDRTLALSSCSLSSFEVVCFHKQSELRLNGCSHWVWRDRPPWPIATQPKIHVPLSSQILWTFSWPRRSRSLLRVLPWTCIGSSVHQSLVLFHGQHVHGLWCGFCVECASALSWLDVPHPTFSISFLRSSSAFSFFICVSFCFSLMFFKHVSSSFICSVFSAISFFLP